MSEKRVTLGGLLGSLVLGAGALVLLAILGGSDRPPAAQSPVPRRDLPYRTGLVDPDVLSIAQICETLPGRIAPPEDLVMQDYRDGEEITCQNCMQTYRINALNTKLVTYANDPQYTYVQHGCPGSGCAKSPESRGYFMDDGCLQKYLDAGYPGVVEGDSVPRDVRVIFRANYGYSLRPDEASLVQRAVHAYILGRAETAKLEAVFELPSRG